MKIVALSISIGILGYFALQALPGLDEAPNLAASSHDANAAASPADTPRVARGRN